MCMGKKVPPLHGCLLSGLSRGGGGGYGVSEGLRLGGCACVFVF